MKPLTTVFLDRDGVINADSPDYITSWSAFHFLPGSLKAIARFTRADLAVIVVTNQSAVGRGMITTAELDSMHRRMCAAVADSGGRITDIFYCPHHPDDGCRCRKPKPGMLLDAQRRYGIDLARCVMVGDSAKDILAGRTAGCGLTVLVRTGDATAAVQSLATDNQAPDHVAADLDRAADWILDSRGTRLP